MKPLKTILLAKPSYTLDLPVGSKLLRIGTQDVDVTPTNPLFRAHDSYQYEFTGTDSRTDDVVGGLTVIAADQSAAETILRSRGYTDLECVNETLHVRATPPTDPRIIKQGVLWYLGHENAATVKVPFISIPTGATLPEGNWRYLGTLQLPGTNVKEAVFHIFFNRDAGVSFID